MWDRTQGIDEMTRPQPSPETFHDRTRPLCFEDKCSREEVVMTHTRSEERKKKKEERMGESECENRATRTGTRVRC